MPLNYKKLTILLVVFLTINLFGQNELVLTPSTGSAETELMAQIIADTVANNGIPEGRVYVLQSGQVYLCQAYMYIPQNAKMHMKTTGEGKAAIYLYPTGTGDNPQNPPGYLFRSRGGDIEMENIAVTGIYEPVDSNFYNMQGGFFRTDAEGANLTFKNCIFSNISGQILRTNSSTGTIRVEDCIFTNLGNLATSNLGAGKGLDLRESSCDSLILLNNTFTNYCDRVIRHYNYGDPTAGTGEIGYTWIDHNTFYGGMGFHGLLSLGNLGDEVVIQNNLFVDAFAAGEDSTDETRAAEFANNGEFYPNGLNKMTWIFGAQNDSTVYNIRYNYYAVSAAGQAFFDAHTEEPITVGSPLTDHIMSKLGANADMAFTMIDYPEFANVQDLMTGTMEYYVDPLRANKTKDTPNDVWNRDTDDMDRRPLTYWINDFDVSYSTSSPAYTGAQFGLPAGDLNAYPEKKAEWDPTVGVEEVPNVVPSAYELSQNYPNPFNPATVITFSIPEGNNVTLKVYDILGREVATLISNEFKSAGQYKVDFNASNLSSGVYFYSLQADNFSSTKKMILMK